MKNSASQEANNPSELKEIPHFFKKHLSEYLFDFFMLFLAITAGFFVNSYQENLSDRNREKEYMKSLVNDLKNDTIAVNDFIKVNDEKIKCIDTILHLFDNSKNPDFEGNLYYYTFKYLNSIQLFGSYDQTIVQLKNAGGFRLIQHNDVSDSIIMYYGSVENVKYNTDFCLKGYYQIIELDKSIFDFRLINKSSTDNPNNTKNFKLIEKDKNKLTFFYNSIKIYVSTLRSYGIMVVNLKTEATGLIKLIEKKYNLKDGTNKDLWTFKRNK